MFPGPAFASLPKPAPKLPRQREMGPITRQILIAVLLFDLAGAGTILGLGEAQAAQRRTTALSYHWDMGHHLPDRVSH
jgi:hypothetical protein